LILLLALGHLANNAGEVHATAKDLQHRCRLNDQQFSGCIEQLVSTGHIAVKGPDAEQGRLHIVVFPEKGWTLKRGAR
jgi:MarR family